MAYSHTTYLQFRNSLASRLGDGARVRWTDAELKVYVCEALRCWNAASLQHRDRAQFPAVAGQRFYDISSALSTSVTTMLGRTVKDRDLVKAIQYHLLEPVTTQSSWPGSDQFTLSDVVGALERRRNQFLVETGITITEQEIDVKISEGEVEMPSAVMDVRRLAWKSTVDMTYTHLWRTDEEAASQYQPEWFFTPGTPADYSVSTAPPYTVQLIPPPVDTGCLCLVSISAGAALNPATGVLMGVPDDFAHFIKWGALADLLSQDGRARDPLRAEYSEQRYREGVQLARIAASILTARIQGGATAAAAAVTSLFDLDAFDPNWQNTSGVPTVVAVGGHNLIALSPAPDSATAYSITLDVVRNAPLPVLDSDYVQIGREWLDVILDYSLHLAMFKEGGEEFLATLPAYERLLRAAVLQNARLKASAHLFETLTDKAQRERKRRPIAEEVQV